MASLRTLFQESRITAGLAIPLMAGQLSQMLMGIVDSAMVGHVGVIPLAACAFANSVLSVPMLLGIGLLVPVAVKVAQAHGAGQRAETGEVLRHGLALSLMAGSLMVGMIWVFGFFLDRFGQPPAVAAEARRYFLITGLSLIPMFASLAIKQFSEALEHPWPPLMILLASVPVNAGLNWIFIYGNLGAPALGLEGAGWATLLSRAIGFLALWLYVRRARRFAGRTPERWLRPLSSRGFTELIRIGGPAAGMLVLESGAFSMAAVMAGWIDAASLAAHQIAISCAGATFMLPLGISIATTIRVGQAIGAGEGSRVRAISVSSLALGGGIMAICGLGLALWREAIPRIFISDPAVIDVAAGLLIVAAVFQISDGIQVIAVGSLRGMADVNVPVIL
jgi:MATE family multidrug resistance protein